MKQLIITFLFLTFSFLGICAKANWEGTTNNNYKHQISIPKDFDFNFPTNEDYYVGFFVIDTFGTYLCVGKTTISATKRQNYVIDLSYDSLGNLGYKKNQRLISLCIPVKKAILKPSENYGLEFLFKDNRNTYTLNDTSYVLDFVMNTWNMSPFGKDWLCKNEPNKLILPFGTNAKIDASDKNLKVNAERNMINTAETSTGYYSFHLNVDITCPVMYYQEETFRGFRLSICELKPILKNEFVLCKDGFIEIEEFPADTLERLPLRNSPFRLEKEGNYSYLLRNKNKSCEVIETVKIIENTFTATINTTDSECHKGGSIEIVSSEKITKICINNETINNPFVENLNVGNYFVQLENEYSCIYEQLIAVKKGKACEEQVLFNPNNANSSIFFNETGKITVININYQEVAHLQGPIEWKGIDDKGSGLPIGLYFVLFENGKNTTITIVK